jgi:hypothetical protein
VTCLLILVLHGEQFQDEFQILRTLHQLVQIIVPEATSSLYSSIVTALQGQSQEKILSFYCILNIFIHVKKSTHTGGYYRYIINRTCQQYPDTFNQVTLTQVGTIP